MGSLLVTCQEKYLSYPRRGGRINLVRLAACIVRLTSAFADAMAAVGTRSDSVPLGLGREGSSDRLKYCSIYIFIQCLHQRVFVTLARANGLIIRRAKFLRI